MLARESFWAVVLDGSVKWRRIVVVDSFVRWFRWAVLLSGSVGRFRKKYSGKKCWVVV